MYFDMELMYEIDVAPGTFEIVSEFRGRAFGFELSGNSVG